jgi:tRNA1Val (adenine37-N6)-methyltransferase
MAGTPFRFKQFDIDHDKCAMKVGTDGVLLGAWCDTKEAARVLDIGTGSGLIALMIAQRNAGCFIDAVEIDDASFLQAQANILRSPWESRIRIHHTSFQEFCTGKSASYDLIVSNPPFFQNSLQNPAAGRSVARHSTSLPVSDLISGILGLLVAGGRYCMIMPVPEARLFIGKAREMGLYCRVITAVIPNPGKPPKRLLLEFNLHDGEVKRSELIVELARRHEYSAEFKELTGDFYLQFRY